MITKRLLDVCDFQGGTQPPKEEWINDPREGYVRMLQIRDYSQGDAKFIQYVKDTKKLHKCKKDDIMLSRYGYIGQAFMGLEGAYNVALVKVIKKEEIHTPYLLYYFKSYYFQHFLLSNVGARATIPGFNKDELENALIRLPEMREQVEIASKIAKVDELIGYHKQQLDILDTLIKSRFIELFGDPVTNEKNWARLTLGDICEIGSSKRVFEKDYVPKGVPFFRTKEIVELSKGNPISTELFINEEHFEKLRKIYGAPKKDDLLISAVGTIGTIWIVSGDFEFYFKDGNLIQIKSSPSFNSIFMKYLLDELIANYKKEMSTGTAYSALTIAGLKKMLVYDVPLFLQTKFATFVEQTDKSKLAIQQSLEQLETLKKSLMQQYFG